MKGLILIGRAILKFLARTKLYIPPVFAGMFVVFTFIRAWTQVGFVEALKQLALKVLGAELTMNQLTTKAIMNPIGFNFIDFLEILTSFIIIFYLIKFFANSVTRVLGANEENYGRWVIGAIIVFLLELTVTSILLETPFSFIPLYNGVGYFIVNFTHVFNAVDWFYLGELGLKSADNMTTNISTNISNS